jgi:hypothetical protein
LQVEFRLMVPRQYNLDLNTSGGSIDVDDLIGEARVKTSGGSLALGRIEGPVDANTSGGSIALRQAKGNVLARTSGGGITVGEGNSSAPSFLKQFFSLLCIFYWIPSF